MKRTVESLLIDLGNAAPDEEVVVVFDGTSSDREGEVGGKKPKIEIIDVQFRKKDKSKPPVNPLMLDVVLNSLFKYLPVSELKTARLVCKKWYAVASLPMQKKSLCRFTIPKEFQCTTWSSEFDTRTKHDQFLHYVRCFVTNKLPFAETSGLVFRNFVFTNFQYFGPYFHGKTIKLLQQQVPEEVRSLRFEDDPNLRISNEFLEISQFQWSDRQFQYPVWATVFTKFSQLQCLELVNMPRGETEKCLTALESLIEKNRAELRIRKLVILPTDQCEFHMNGDAYLSYVDLLKNVISLLPVVELHLASKCSAKEVKSIVESRREQLETLILKRFVRTESSIYGLQEKDESLFKNAKFPNLKRLRIPWVYVDSLTQVVSACPELTDFALHFQSVEICELVTNTQGAQVIQTTRATLKSTFFSDSDQMDGKNSKITALQWSLDDRIIAGASSFRKQISQFNFFCTSFLTRLLPQVKSFTGIIMSERELRVVFENLRELEELRVTRESYYVTKDVDIIGALRDSSPPCNPLDPQRKLMDDSIGRSWGIRLLTNLKRLYLDNDNNQLSYNAFDYGFLKLPSLQVLHIRRAKRLSEDNTAIVALLDSSSLMDVQISEN